MRLISIILLLTLTVSCFSQISDTQVKLYPSQTPDSIMVLSNDTNNLNPGYRHGKWKNLRALGDAFGWNSGGPGGGANLTIGGSGPTYTIDSDSGTDVTIAGAYAILLSESPANTLNFKVDTSYIATLYDITQIPINYIRDATATNTANHANYNQVWTWNGLTSGSGLKLSSNSTVAASNTQRLFEVNLSGINGTATQTTVAGYFTNSHSGSNNTNYGVYSLQTGSPSSAFPGAAVYGLGDFIGVHGFSSTSASSVGVQGDVTSGIGMYATATSGNPFKGRITAGSSTLDALMILQKFQSGSASTFMGGTIPIMLETSGSALDTSLTIVSRWTDKTASAMTGQFTIRMPNSGTQANLFQLAGSGRTTLNKYGVGSFTSGTPTYNIVVDASGNLMEAAVPVGGLNVVEENNATVQSANINIDFQNPFDVATDGASEVNISLDCGEFTTVTTVQSDDYMLMHDSGAPANEKILWTDVLIDLISFKDDNSSIGTGNAIDVSAGLNLVMSPSTEANIGLDFGELLLDGTPEANGTEYFIVYDSDTTAGHQTQRFRYSDVVGGSDTNFAEDDLTFTGNRTHDMDAYTLSLHGDAMNVTFKDDNGGTGDNIIIVSEQGAATGVSGGISFETQNTGTPTDMFDLEANKRGTNKSTLTIKAEQGTDAHVVYEKNDGLSNNTTESHYSINGGISKTQNYEWTATGADLTIDRAFYNISVSGSGALGDEINLPEVASTVVNWDNSLTDAQVQVGQEYVITNFRAATNLVLRAFSGDEINGAGVTNIPITPTSSVILKCVRFSGGIGYWKTY